jgi:hypothetical protein
MAPRYIKATTSGATAHRKKRQTPKLSRRNPQSRRDRLKRSRTHDEVRYRGARISRARLGSLRDQLDGMRNTVSDVHDNFWFISEQDIRETLAKTKQKLGRAVDVLERAA